MVGRVLLISSLIAGCAVGSARGQSAPIQFVDESTARGLLPSSMAPGMGGGVAAADFDDDGDIDLFLPNALGYPDQLYRNLGDGTFEEIATAAGVASLDQARVALWLDYDGDGRLDLLVAGDCHGALAPCTEVSTLKLYRQIADAQFQDVTLEAGITDDRVVDTTAHRAGAAAGDFNNDGYLDLVVSLWTGKAGVYLNNGNGTFTDIGVASGVGVTQLAHWQPILHDFNRDGWLDLFFAVDFAANRLWINNGDNTFTNVAQSAGVDNAWNDMGVALSDYDNDWDADLYITNITNVGTGRHNVLYRNQSVASLAFVDVAAGSGVHAGAWGWGTTFLDADNDGLLDLAATNGFNGVWSTDTSRFFLSSGGTPVTFQDRSAATGFDDSYWGSSLLAVDADRDGYLDLVQTCNAVDSDPSRLRLLRNQPGPAALANGYLVVRPRMTGPNHRTIGAVVRVEVGSAKMMRVITAGTSFLGQEPAEAAFGIGSASMVDQVTIEWPDGTETKHDDVAGNQVLTITVDPDTDGDGTPDPLDLDDDGDGALDGEDCAPTSAQAWATPGEVTGLILTDASGETDLSWSAPDDPGGTLQYYDTLVATAPDGFDVPTACAERNGSDLQTLDANVPDVGAVRYYVVRAGNACGEGSGGSGSLGAPRSLQGCP